MLQMIEEFHYKNNATNILASEQTGNIRLGNLDPSVFFIDRSNSKMTIAICKCVGLYHFSILAQLQAQTLPEETMPGICDCNNITQK